MANTPEYAAPASQACDNAAQKIGMIHPGLYEVGPRASDESPKPPQSPHADAPARHVEAEHRYPGSCQFGAVLALIHQRNDDMHVSPVLHAQAVEHAFRAAVSQFGNDMEDFHGSSGRHIMCRHSGRSVMQKPSLAHLGDKESSTCVPCVTLYKIGMRF